MGVEPDPETGKLKLNKRFSQINEWEDIMHSVYELPIEIEGYAKQVSELKFLKEIIDKLSRQEFDNVKRSESRKKQLSQFVQTMHQYYNLVFSSKGEKTGYGVLIYFPNLGKDPERSRGIVLVERKTTRNKKSETKFEKAKFGDFLIDVRPYIEIIGDLYRKSRKS